MNDINYYDDKLDGLRRLFGTQDIRVEENELWVDERCRVIIIPLAAANAAKTHNAD